MEEEQLLKSGERINQLFSTDIKIIQNREVFSYSVDSVLLSRFPRFPKKGLIVDFCAGNGAVGLFASTRTQAQILAVEIQERLADMAERSVRLNGLEEQMEVICDDLKNMPSRIQGSKVDMILCNPPYFKVDPHSNLNESEHYLLARHEITTNLEEICRSAQSILKSNGRLAMVHRPDRLLDILDSLQRHNLAPKRLQFVYPKREKEANMLLIEAIKDGSTSGFKVLPPLIVHNMMAPIRLNLKRFIMDHKAYMYVLECRDGSYYTGYTTDVRRRLAVHNSGKGAKYTRARLPVKLIYAQGFASKAEAMSAEALLKRKKRPQKERFFI